MKKDLFSKSISLRFNKNILATAITFAIGATVSAHTAALSSGNTLNFVLGTAMTGQACTVSGTFPSNCRFGLTSGSDIVGSYFSMDVNNDGNIGIFEKTPIGSFNGLVIGVPQPAANSHSSGINGSEIPNIDSPWVFFGNTGMHQTSAPVTVLSDFGSVKHLDMSGWNIHWNGLSPIPMVGTGDAVLACDANCDPEEDYVLDAPFHMAGAGFTTVPYTVHLEGTIEGDSMLPFSVTIVIAGGLTQECDIEGGNTVTMSASVLTPVPDDVAAISWFIDDVPVGQGVVVDIDVPLGLHTVKAVLDTTQSGSTEDTQAIFIQDTVSPDVDLDLVDAVSGVTLNSVTSQGNGTTVRIVSTATDVCDPEPAVNATIGVPAQDGDEVTVSKGNKKKTSVLLSSPTGEGFLKLNVEAEDASGNKDSKSKLIDIN